MWDRKNLFIFLNSIIIGSLCLLWLGGELIAKEYKIGSRTPLTIGPLTQSAFGCTLSIPVMLIGLSLLYDPAINW